MDLLEQFDNFRITNGKWRKREKGVLKNAIKLGCTGALSAEAETTTITKKCEGKVAREVTRVTKISGTFTGHVAVGVLRDMMGLTNVNLKEGVYGLSELSSGANGAIMFEVYDLDDNKKNIAFPNINWSMVNIIGITNGEEEIAEIEAPFSALIDDNKYFYYEGFEDDITDESVRTGWNASFTPELVSKPSL